MSKHTTHLCESTIQKTLDDNAFIIGAYRARIVGPDRPAKTLDSLFKNQSERLRARRTL